MNHMNTRISRIVAESGLTKTAFGKRIGVSQSMISMICNGSAKPSDRTISDICREFHIRREWLENGEEPMRYPDADENLDYVDALLADADDPVIAFVKVFMRTYNDLTPENKAIIRAFVQKLRDSQ